MLAFEAWKKHITTAELFAVVDAVTGKEVPLYRTIIGGRVGYYACPEGTKFTYDDASTLAATGSLFVDEDGGGFVFDADVKDVSIAKVEVLTTR